MINHCCDNPFRSHVQTQLDRNKYNDTPPIQGTVLTPPKTITDFNLIDHRSEPFRLAALQGKWSFVFFGYTHCPDICPTTLATLAQMDKLLAEDAAVHEQTQVVFISVDPGRDTAAQLARYVPYFNQRFVGVTGTQEEIDRLTRELGILHLRIERGEGKPYLVDHSTAILLFQPDGTLRALLTAPHEAQRLSSDFRAISGF